MRGVGWVSHETRTPFGLGFGKEEGRGESHQMIEAENVVRALGQMRRANWSASHSVGTVATRNRLTPTWAHDVMMTATTCTVRPSKQGFRPGPPQNKSKKDDAPLNVSRGGIFI